MEVVQYIGGCSVHRGDNISTVGGELQYCRGIASVLWRLFSTAGGSVSTVGGSVSTVGG